MRTGVRATDDDLQALRRVPHVIEVDLCGTAATDSAIDILLALPELQYVTVFGSNISPRGVARLQETNTRLDVHTEDPLGFNPEDK